MELRPLPLVSFSGGHWLLRRPRHIGPQLSGRLARMPRSSENVPALMLGLPPRAREKGIEIADALLAEGVHEGKAIRIAIAKAEQWAERHRDRRNCE